jgi:hypothetical protein
MSFGDSLFGDIIEWFLGRAGDRRQYKRRAGAFHMWYQPDPNDSTRRTQGVGLEISPNGVAFILPEAIRFEQFNILVHIREREIPLRVKRVRNDQVTHQGKTWNRYMCEFVGVASDHWDAIVAYVSDQPDPERRKMQNQEAITKVDDAYRLLPLALQQKIVALLVSQGKLDQAKDGQTPLLKLFYGGLVKRPGTKPAHRFNVHSRVARNGEMVAYDTRFLIDEDGAVTVL